MQSNIKTMDKKQKTGVGKQVSGNESFKKKFIIWFWSLFGAGAIAIVLLFRCRWRFPGSCAMRWLNA